jgi:hypothetical protein
VEENSLMSSALDNLKANMAEQGMLTADGDIPQWLRGVEYGVPEVTPIQIGTDIYNRGGGDGGVDTPPGVPRTPEQGFRDWWNLDDDLVGGRQISQGLNFLAGGGMLGHGLISLGDYSQGVNPLADLSAMTVANMAVPYASNMQEAIGLSKAGAFGGDWIGNSLIGNEINGEYIPTYTESMSNSPWHGEATAMGLEQGTKGYDNFMNAVSGGLARNKGVDPEMMEAYDRRGEERWRDPEYRSSLMNPSKEPESVSDFTGMFSGIGDSISNFFGFSDSNNSIDLNEIARNDTSVGVSDNSGGWSSADEQSYADEVGVSEY